MNLKSNITNTSGSEGDEEDSGVEKEGVVES